MRTIILTKDELDIIDRFTKTLYEFEPPEKVDNINKFRYSPEWLKVVSAAENAIEEWKGLDSFDVEE